MWRLFIWLFQTLNYFITHNLKKSHLLTSSLWVSSGCYYKMPHTGWVKSRPELKARASQMAQWVKNLPAIQETQETWVWSVSQEDIRGGHGNPLQYSYLESLVDRWVWRATVHSVARNWTQSKQLSRSKIYFTKKQYVIIEQLRKLK